MNIDVEILNKTLGNQIQQHIKKTIHDYQVGVVPQLQEWFNIHKSMWYINKRKDKNHMTQKKKLIKFNINSWQKPLWKGREGIYFNIIQNIYVRLIVI